MACPPVLKMKLTIEPMRLGKRNAVFYQSVGDLSPCFCPVISGNLLLPLWQCQSSPWWQAQRRWGWSHAFTSAEREVKDSRRSGMYQSWNFWDKIGHARSVGFWFYSAIWRSESRDHFDFFALFSNLFEEERIIILAFPRFEPTHLSLVPSGPRPVVLWPKVFRNLKHALVMGQDWVCKFAIFWLVSAISRTLWYLEINSSLVFNLLEE